MITITACALLYVDESVTDQPCNCYSIYMTLGVAMVASPGAPGGSIMTALPFLYMVFGTTAGDTNGPNLCFNGCTLYHTGFFRNCM